ncbi:unnamed protein product, partial [marine sediment metagenome]
GFTIQNATKAGILLGITSGVKINNNVIQGCTRYGIIGGEATNGHIGSNLIQDCQIGVYLDRGSGATIEKNTIDGMELTAIVLTGGGGLDVQNTLIVDNVLTNNGESGINIALAAEGTTITRNTISGNFDGIRIWECLVGDIAASTTHINQNNIAGNENYGVLNEIATLVDATNNWWGTTVAENISA